MLYAGSPYIRYMTVASWSDPPMSPLIDGSWDPLTHPLPKHAKGVASDAL